MSKTALRANKLALLLEDAKHRHQAYGKYLVPGETPPTLPDTGLQACVSPPLLTPSFLRELTPMLFEGYMFDNIY